jgi:redox-sensitive bicupin YhaK (pirin superfamily)
VIDVRRAASRDVTQTDWLVSRHSFAYGAHYDPDNASYGRLVAHNEDVLAPGAGFASHRHRGVDLVTWVVSGTLVHEDSLGNRGEVTPGVVQVLSAGTGVEHVERNGSTVEPVYYVQAWVAPDDPDLPPTYALSTATSAEVAGGRFSVERLAAGQRAGVGGAPYVHLFLARGALQLDQVALAAGDAVRLTAQLTQVRATEPCELLVWTMAAALGGR